MEILDQKDVPEWLILPPEYLRMVRLNVVHLEPWHLLDASERHAEQGDSSSGTQAESWLHLRLAKIAMMLPAGKRAKLAVCRSFMTLRRLAGSKEEIAGLSPFGTGLELP